MSGRVPAEPVAVVAKDSAVRSHPKEARAVLHHALDIEIGQAFRVIGVPTVFLIDSKGIVRYKNPLVPGNIEERIKKLKD